MDTIWNGLVQAVVLLLRGDPAVWDIVLRSLVVSGTATVISVLGGIPLGLALALARFPGRTGVISVVNSGMGLPPVVVGLVLSLLLWRTGPFGWLHLLYTPAALVLAQVVLALPLVAALTLAAVQQLDPRLRLQIQALGADPPAAGRGCCCASVRRPLLAVVMAGFGAVISEVGASLMVGGNIVGRNPRADHRDRAGDRQGRLRRGDCALGHPAGADLCHRRRADLAAATRGCA